MQHSDDQMAHLSMAEVGMPTKLKSWIWLRRSRMTKLTYMQRNSPRGYTPIRLMWNRVAMDLRVSVTRIADILTRNAQLLLTQPCVSRATSK